MALTSGAQSCGEVGRVGSVERSRLLVIEDDTRIGSSLARALEGSGYNTTWAPTAQAGLDEFTQALRDCAPFRLVLLDLGLPDANGLDVCRTLVTADPLIPVIMLTAYDDELDSVIGLDAGAVDYVTKPFSLAPLLARIRAQLRRNDHNIAEPHIPEVLLVGTLSIYRKARRVVQNGVEIAMRPKEFDLLMRLVLDAGVTVKREALMSDVWDSQWFGSTKTLDFHIAALRAKLDPGLSTKLDAALDPKLDPKMDASFDTKLVTTPEQKYEKRHENGPRGSIITTIRGVGFRLER
jgi:DNA-binding response OmpR family regulator